MMEQPRLPTDPDTTLERYWNFNLALPSPFPVTLAIGGLVVTGRPIGAVEFQQRLNEHLGDLAEAAGDLTLAQDRRQHAGESSASLTQAVEAAPSEGRRVIESEYFHFADAVIHGAGDTPLAFRIWRCPMHLVTGWSFGRPGEA